MLYRTIISVLFLTIQMFSAHAQSWHKLAGLSPNVILSQVEVAANGDLYALTSDHFIFYSTDHGVSWKPFSPPPFLSYTANARVMHYNNSTQTLFLGTSISGLSYTANRGAQWGQEFFSTSNPSGLHESILNIASNGNLIVVSGNASIGNQQQRYFFSTNNGNSWSNARLGFGFAESILIDSASHWIVATSLGLQKSTDQGNSWQVLAFMNQKVRAVIKTQTGSYYVITEGNPGSNTFHLHASSDLVNWNLRQSFNATGFNNMTYAPLSGSLLLATTEGLYRYDMGGNTLDLIAMDIVTDAEETANSIVYTAESQIGLRSGTSPGFNWQNHYSGLTGTVTYQTGRFLISDSTIYTISGINRLVNRFTGFDSTRWEYSFVNDISHTLSSPHVFLDITSNGDLFSGGSKNLYRSQDRGQSWMSVTTPALLPPNNNGTWDIYYFRAGRNDRLFLAQRNDNVRLWQSTDQGQSWQVLLDNNTLQAMGISMALDYVDIVSDTAGNIYAGIRSLNLSHKLLKSTDGGISWSDITPSFFGSFSGPYTLLSHSSGAVYVVNGRSIFSISPSAAAVPVPWSVTNTEILRLTVKCNSAGDMYANISGTEHCNACGIYKREDTTWTYIGSPSILGNYTPVTGLELIGDTIPVVQTSYSMTQGPIVAMGYYYFSAKPLPVGISEKPSIPKETLSLYPNPSQGVIKTDAPDGAELRIYSISGQLLRQQRVSSGQEIDIRALGAGIFYVEVFTAKGMSTTILIAR